MPPHAHHLPYVQRLQQRSADAIQLLVVHCTELPDLAEARRYGEREVHASGTGNSGHYYIDRDGRCEEYVPVDRIAHHVRGWNAQSIGVELVNRGRYPDWLDSRLQQMQEPYPTAQIVALLALIDWLKPRCSQLTGIAGHEDLDLDEVAASDNASLKVRRKRDPGPLFPWEQVLTASGLKRRFAAQMP